MVIKTSIIATLMCLVLGATSNPGVAQINATHPALRAAPQVPSDLHCKQISTDELVCKPLPPKSSFLEKSLKHSPEAANATFAVYVANNVTTKSGMTKWVEKIVGSRSLAVKLGPKIFSYSRSVPVRSVLGFVVVGTTVAAIYEFIHGDDVKSESDDFSGLSTFSVSANGQLREVVHSKISP